jgi:hypothetical protein
LPGEQDEASYFLCVVSYPSSGPTIGLPLRKTSNRIVKHQYPERFNPDVIPITAPERAAMWLADVALDRQRLPRIA